MFDVVVCYFECFLVYVLIVYCNGDKFVEQCLCFVFEVVVVGDVVMVVYVDVKLCVVGSKMVVLYGLQVFVDVLKSDGCDMVVVVIVGVVGFVLSLVVVCVGKWILFVNKEVFVMLGVIFMDVVCDYGVILLLVDSEYNVIFQCMLCDVVEYGGILKIILIVLGGLFCMCELVMLVDVMLDEVCKYLNWVMGCKILVDFVMMMNKGFEVIEVYWIFGLLGDWIDVLIYLQSVIYLFVLYCDGLVFVQFGNFDMCMLIVYVFVFFECVDVGVDQFDFVQIVQLLFEKFDYVCFLCFVFVLKVFEEGGIVSVVLNVVNEVVVEVFFECWIGFMVIVVMVDVVFNMLLNCVFDGFDDVFVVDVEVCCFVVVIIVKVFVLCVECIV